MTDLEADLPTEAQWEYACRAGTQTAYSFGDSEADLSRHGNAETGDSFQERAGVGIFLPNPWGLYDMHGNVWVWCLDWSAPYDTEPAVDPVGPLVGTARVARGGSWFSAPVCHRSAFRFKQPPTFQQPKIGFRLCINVE